MATLCDICHVRPATVRAEVVSNGRRETLNLCDVDYRRLARQQRSSSPLESLFGGRGSLFDDFFDDDGFFGRSSGRGRAPEEDEASAPEGAARGGSSGGPARARGGAARSGGGAENLSEHAMEILQQAARRTAESGRREVDTEHLLLALTESDVVRTILEQFKVSLDDLRRQVEQETPRARAAGSAGATVRTTRRPRSASRRGSRTRSPAPSPRRATSAIPMSGPSTS